ncbi:MAG: selenide, water dikinase SelD [Acidisphaera sp.]|nr:selenide, water dikinase SelD [Acidisphaera sp.]
MRTGPVETDIVLLGAGHAHVEVLRRFAMRPARGLRITLIAREPHTPYSGMLPGLVRGDYAFDEAHIDLAPLAAASGARLILAEAISVELAARTVTVSGRTATAYDLLSIDVGGVPDMPASGGIPVKPIGRFLERLASLEAHLEPGSRLAVVGAGAGGTELALALAHRFAGRARIVLVGRDPQPLPAAPARAQAVARAALAQAGVELVCGVAALAHGEGRLRLADGGALAVQEALWVTGVRAPDFLVRSGLACGAGGFVRVAPSLQSLSHAGVFAAGDCAAIEGAGRPKSGVWAVRAGAPLAANLRRAAAGRPLRPWHPQRRALAILGLGDGRALAWRGDWTFSGRAVWRWKDRIDRNWMAMYARLRPMLPAEPMRCGGCGAKVGAEVLTASLAGMAGPARPDIVGLEAPDDAAITLPPPGLAVVQSVDHFRAFLDDPFVFGEIAAAHALSDIHAMGAQPWTAMAIAAVPAMPPAKMRADLAAMMQGAAGVLRGDGCVLVGGHSAEAAEAALGFSVTGLVAPERAWRKSGLRPGDALLLTKPLGTGIVLAAQMRGLARARWLEAAVAGMRTTNATAARILRDHGTGACTDVTGFGLAGHLLEMLLASEAAARLIPDALPLLPGAAELAGRGIASTLAPENLRLLQRAFGGEASGPWSPLLVDPQTSGGLLAGLPRSQSGACVAALRAAGAQAAVIGEVVRPDGRVRLFLQ